MCQQQCWGSQLRMSLIFKNIKTAVEMLRPSVCPKLHPFAVQLGPLLSPGHLKVMQAVFVRVCLWCGFYFFVRQDSRALLHLGRCYDRGFGVRQDSTLATGYYERAARAGNSQAVGLLRLRREGKDGRCWNSAKKMGWAGLV